MKKTIINTGPWCIISDENAINDIKYSNCEKIVLDIEEKVLDILTKDTFSEYSQYIMNNLLNNL